MMKNFEQFDREHKVNEEAIFESMGGRLVGAFADLKEMTTSLGNASSKITDSDIGGLLKAIDALEETFKKKLKGKGISRW